jgi:hypothetical protein
MRLALAAALAAAAALSGCMSPDEVAWRRCEAAGIYPGDPTALDCYDRQMDRIERANEALTGAGIGILNAQRPVYYLAPLYP